MQSASFVVLLKKKLAIQGLEIEFSYSAVNLHEKSSEVEEWMVVALQVVENNPKRELNVNSFYFFLRYSGEFWMFAGTSSMDNVIWDESDDIVGAGNFYISEMLWIGDIRNVSYLLVLIQV